MQFPRGGKWYMYLCINNAIEVRMEADWVCPDVYVVG